ncbi:hypothetical protein [Pararhizobium sp. O133]|uniref:hypothetical protein n=1 Tax=Pararhizobium sp. O133 TaxID=3449278 RepID=UPI003F687FFF
MHTIALLLAGTLLLSPEDKPAIPNYFDDNRGSNPPIVEICNLNGEDVSGQFKTCRYDCGRTLTIGERSICPFVLQR